MKHTSKQLPYHRSSILGAMVWMVALSLVLTVLSGWIPVVGSAIGPVVGGYIGGRKAGSVGRAAAAAVLPAVIFSLFILGIGALAAALGSIPLLGAVAAVVAGVVGITLIIHNVVLFVLALIGGWSRQIQAA